MIYFQGGDSVPTRGRLELQTFLYLDSSVVISKVSEYTITVHRQEGEGENSILYTDLANVMVYSAFKFNDIFVVRAHVNFSEER